MHEAAGVALRKANSLLSDSLTYRDHSLLALVHVLYAATVLGSWFGWARFPQDLNSEESWS